MLEFYLQLYDYNYKMLFTQYLSQRQMLKIWFRNIRNYTLKITKIYIFYAGWNFGKILGILPKFHNSWSFRWEVSRVSASLDPIGSEDCICIFSIFLMFEFYYILSNFYMFNRIIKGFENFSWAKNFSKKEYLLFKNIFQIC